LKPLSVTNAKNGATPAPFSHTDGTYKSCKV